MHILLVIVFLMLLMAGLAIVGVLNVLEWIYKQILEELNDDGRTINKRKRYKK